MLVTLLLLACHPDAATSEACDACGGACTVENIPATSQDHVAGGIDYPDTPPTGGDHDACWLRYQAYETEQPDEQMVHDLEHGGVVFLWNCPDDGCPDDVAAIEGLVAKDERTLSMPYAEMPTKFAALAWEWRMETDCADVDALQAFYDDHFDQGREHEPSDGACGTE